MLNPFFLQGSPNEQGLLQDLVNEHLRMFGIDVYYLPRQYATEKTVIREVIESKFKSAFPIEAYLDTYEGYGNQGTILSKFGIQELDDVTLIISRERWRNYISQLIKSQPDIKLSSRPKEGDLIYFPLGNRFFEIKYVEHERPFYQLKKNYVYELRCELFRYQDEIIDTGIEFIDNPLGPDDGDGTGDDLDDRDDFTVTQTLQLVGMGSTATAIASVVNGGVRFVTVTNRGNGYRNAPTVGFSTSPQRTATGIATMIGGIVDLCEPNETFLRVQGVELTNTGFGYTVAPMVSFIGGGGGSGASAVATIGDGIVGVVTVTNGGSGYLNPPTITIVGVSSITAEAKSVIEPSGELTQIRIINAGLGYSEAPTIEISNPDVMIGFGTYIRNEVVVGSISSITAVVKTWNVNTKILEVSNSTGVFRTGELIIGQTSNAVWGNRVANLSAFRSSFGQNNDIQDEANKILDFSEKNPFGTP